MSSERSARLTLVATPIGNLGDLSPRAIEALATADVICCEDTRHTGRLLQHAGVHGPRLLRVDEHTEAAAVERVLRLLEDGAIVAMVTDAGLPGVADPGERLVAAVADAGHVVSVVPGPSAGLAALVASGLSTSRFTFQGFLPRKGRARAERLREVAVSPVTSVLYESAKRLPATLADLADACGPGRAAAVARELTKLHEEVVRAPLSELVTWAGEGVRGEVVVVIDGAPASDAISDRELATAIRRSVADGASRRDAARDVAARFGVARRRTYEIANAVTGDKPAISPD